jgi:molybdenum cofactor guanylyltransferase
MSLFGSAVILAGGRGLRMGFNKSQLALNGKPLMTAQSEVLHALFQEIVISASPDLIQPFEGGRVVLDEYPGCGPLGGIYQGLKSAASDYVYVIGCDMPFINLDYIRYMMERVTANRPDICITAHGEFVEPLNAFYSKNLLSPIESMLKSGRNSLHDLFSSHSTLTIAEHQARIFDARYDMFINLNSQDDIRFLEKFLNSRSEAQLLTIDSYLFK